MEQSAYDYILGLCKSVGIIDKDELTTSELKIILIYLLLYINN